MLSALFSMAVLGLFTAGVIAIAELAIMTVKYLVDYAKRKLKANNNNKIMVSQTKDLFKDKMDSADKTSLAELERMTDECPVITGFYNADTDEIEDIKAIKTNSLETNLKNALTNAKDGMLVIEN